MIDFFDFISSELYPRFLRYIGPELYILALILLLLLADTKLLIERLRLRLAPQEFLQNLHLLFASTTLEHSVPVPATLLAVHGIGLEDGVEHVGGVDL
jgi:hypothetical protein